MAGHDFIMEAVRRAFKILMGEPIGKRFLGTPKLRRENNISIDLKEIIDNTKN